MSLSPSEIVVQHLPQKIVPGRARVDQSLVEAGNRTAVHFVVLSIATVQAHDGRLVTIAVGLNLWLTKCFGPISGASLDMLGAVAMTETVCDHVVGHYLSMPSAGKTA